MRNNIDPKLFKQIQEGPISQEQLRIHYTPTDYSVFFYAYERESAQSNISQDLYNNIEDMSPKEIFINTIKTVKFKKHIQDYLSRIENTISSLKHIKDTTGGRYGLHLELRIPQLEEKSKRIHDRIDTNYKASNTHMQLSNRQKELIQQERLDIQNEMEKFIEDLREYL